MDQPAAHAAAQRVCPHCARISYATGRHCPYCGRGFRRSLLLGVAAMLAVLAVVLLGGTYLMFVAAGNELDDRIEREVDRVERELDDNLQEIERDIRRELDRRLPVPSPAP